MARSQQVTETLHLKLGSNDLDVFPSSVEYIPGSKGDEGNDNDLSLVASLTGNGASYLFAGDLEKEGIDAFLEARHGQFDVVKMPHHGKKSSGTNDFVESVKPRIAVITDSNDDPADKKTLKALDEVGADVYRTSTSGTIAVSNDDAGHYSVCKVGRQPGLRLAVAVAAQSLAEHGVIGDIVVCHGGGVFYRNYRYYRNYRNYREEL